jgi:effector-binding domain-containing protein
MLLRYGLCAGLAAAMIALGVPLPSSAESPTESPPAAAPKADSAPKTDAAPAVPTPPAKSAETDPFGEDATLTAKPIVYLKGSGSWDSAFQTITNSLKTIKDYIGKEGLKADGDPMTIFTATDDTGFQFEAAVPVAEPPKDLPKGQLAVGKSPQGHALKFVHRGSYDGLDNTYEAITNYLDDHRLEAKDMFIEQYVTDPMTTNQDHLVVNIYVLVK